MKQSLALVLEQIQAGLFTYDECVRIVTAVSQRIKADYPELTSKCDELAHSLDKAIAGWDDESL